MEYHRKQHAREPTGTSETNIARPLTHGYLTLCNHKANLANLYGHFFMTISTSSRTLLNKFIRPHYFTSQSSEVIVNLIHSITYTWNRKPSTRIAPVSGPKTKAATVGRFWSDSGYLLELHGQPLSLQHKPGYCWRVLRMQKQSKHGIRRNRNLFPNILTLARSHGLVFSSKLMVVSAAVKVAVKIEEIHIPIMIQKTAKVRPKIDLGARSP